MLPSDHPPATAHWDAIRGRRVFARVDLNVEHASDELWRGDIRVRQAVHLARRLAELGCVTVLASHFGRPEGCPLATHSMAHIPARLQRVFDLEVTFLPSLASAPQRMAGAPPGSIFLLENLRFDPGEKTADPEFAARLAQLADCYIHEAFAASHRPHASLAVLPTLLPAYVGPGLAAERARAKQVVAQMKKPLVVVAGGSKVDKLALYRELSWCAEALLLSSAFAAALEQEPWLLDGFAPSVVPPADLYVASGNGVEVVERAELRRDLRVLDVGPRTQRQYLDVLSRAGTILYNGSLGILAASDARSSSARVGHAVQASPAMKILCGGTGATLESHVAYRFSGGGALLAHLVASLGPASLAGGSVRSA